MKFLIIFMLACIAFCSNSAAQVTQQSNAVDDVSKAMVLAFSRMDMSVNVAIWESEQPDSDMNYTDEQRDQLAAMKTDFMEMHRIIREKSNGGRDWSAALRAEMFDMGNSLTSRLHEEILIPFQSRFLKSMVLEKFVADKGGDLGAALCCYYQDEIAFTDLQRRELAEMEDDWKRQVKEAKERFKKDLERIAEGAEKKLRNSLSRTQKEKLDGYQGR